MCVYIQRPEVNVIRLPLLLSSLCSEKGQALSLNYELINSYNGQSATLGDLSVLFSLVLGLWKHSVIPSFLQVLGLQLKSSSTLSIELLPISSTLSPAPFNFKEGSHVAQTGLEFLTLVFLLGLQKYNIKSDQNFYFYNFILYVQVFCLYVYPCIMCMPGDLRGLKRVSVPVEVKLHMVMSYHMGIGNETQVLWKNKAVCS